MVAALSQSRQLSAVSDDSSVLTVRFTTHAHAEMHCLDRGMLHDFDQRSEAENP